MRGSLRIAAVVACGILVLLALCAGGLYYGTQVEPDFYQQALLMESDKLEKGSDEMLAKTTALVSLARKKGSWEAVFSEAEINGWLAIDLQKKNRRLLPAGIKDPRVVIEPDRAHVGWRMEQNGFSSVVWLDLEIFLSETDELAFRIHSARAGAVPLPLNSILDEVGKAARGARVQIRWVQADGDPVALIKIPVAEDGKLVRRVKVIQLREGELYLSGVSEPITKNESSEAKTYRFASQGVASQIFEKVKTQR